MKVVAKIGKEEVALVYIAESEQGRLIEFVESVQPPYPRIEKWILMISTLYGCPVKCLFCDASSDYQGKLSIEDLIFQIDYLIKGRFPDRKIPVKKFKIQFARMGEPSFNNNVLELLDILPQLYDAPGLIPSFSTIAPAGREKFFEKLIEVKNRHYIGKFQFQFSLHTTDETMRKVLIPTRTWSFYRMAEYGKEFHKENDKKITLNFALAKNAKVNPEVLLKYFSPALFLIKITPVNPTYKAVKNRIHSAIINEKEPEIINELRNAGYEVILSIGELEENLIGSNCGQYLAEDRKSKMPIEGGYTYEFTKL